MSKWYKASELERLNTPMPMDGVNGLPDNHVITVSERVIEVDEPELVQNNVSTDTFTLVLDAEWDDVIPSVIFSNSQGDYKVTYENGPTKIPAAVMAVVGSVDVSVFGLDSTGEVRVVTKAAPGTMNVVESGKFVGEVSEDDVSLLGQILAAAEAANKAAAAANATIVKSAVATTLNPGEPATANLADNVLTIGVPKGEKGEKGDPGQDGVTPFTQATVTTLEPGTPATVAIAEDTLKLGIPKGDKGDTGDPGHTPQRGVDYWTAEDVEAVVEDAKAQAVAELAEIGNVPKGTASGYVAHSEDAYAAKPVEVRVKGRTVKNLWPAIESVTNNGITATMDETGLITLRGTATLDSSLSFGRISMVDRRSYTVNVSQKVSGVRLFINRYDAEDAPVSPRIIDIDLTTITTITKVADLSNIAFTSTFLFIPKGTTVNASFRVMLVEGTEAPDCFTPPASITSVQPGNLVTAGKNLLSVYPGMPRKTTNANIEDGDIVVGIASNGLILPNAITDIEISDGEISANIKSFGYGLGFVRYLPQGTQFAVSLAGSNTIRATFSYVSMEKTVLNRNDFDGSDLSTAGVVPNGCIGVCVIIRNATESGEFPGAITCYPQLELSSTATAYEPPNVTTTPLPEVELRSLPNGTCDELVIETDGTCRVERKVAKETFGEGVVTGTGTVPEGDAYQYIRLTASERPIDGDYSFLCDRFNIASRKPYNVYVAGGNANAEFFFTFPLGTFSDRSEIAAWFAANPTTVVYRPQAELPTEPQSPVTLPVLPAPTFNVYHESQVPSDTSVEYTRDINIVLADLEAQIADLVTKEAANV